MEVDILTPEELYNKFSEFPPILMNAEVIKKRKLVSVYAAKRIALIFHLLDWYMKHGLIVTKLYGTVEAKPVTVFKDFGEWVVNERRKGKTDSSLTTRAECAKLFGN